MRKGIVVASLILVLSAVPVFAQVHKGDWEISPMAGYSFNGAEFKNGAMGSLSIGYNFTKAWGLELQFAYTNSSVWDLNRDMYALRLSGLYNFRTDKRTVPYLKFGLGSAAMSPDNFGNVFSGDQEVHLGAGMRWFLSPRVALRMEALAAYTYNAKYGNMHDYRATMISPGLPIPPFSPPEYRVDTIYPVKNTYMKYEVLVGFSFFPKKHSPPPPPAPAPAPVAQRPATPPPPPPPPPPAPEKKAPAEPQMMTISVNEVVSHFVLNKWNLPADGVELLDEAVSKLQKYPGLRVNIVGYTDSTGPAKWNAILSKRRAKSVEKYLLAHGVSADRIASVSGEGPSNPVATNKTKAGRSLNRRAEVKSVEPVHVTKK